MHPTVLSCDTDVFSGKSGSQCGQTASPSLTGTEPSPHLRASCGLESVDKCKRRNIAAHARGGCRMWIGNCERSIAPGPQGTAWGDTASGPSRQRLQTDCRRPARAQCRTGLWPGSATCSIGPASEQKPEVRGAGQQHGRCWDHGPEQTRLRSPGWSGLGHMGLSVSLFAQ